MNKRRSMKMRVCWNRETTIKDRKNKDNKNKNKIQVKKAYMMVKMTLVSMEKELTMKNLNHMRTKLIKRKKDNSSRNKSSLRENPSYIKIINSRKKKTKEKTFSMISLITSGKLSFKTRKSLRQLKSKVLSINRFKSMKIKSWTKKIGFFKER